MTGFCPREDRGVLVTSQRGEDCAALVSDPSTPSGFVAIGTIAAVLVRAAAEGQRHER